MLRIITPDTDLDSKASPSEEALSSGDVEYVVGRRQMASLGFMVVLLLAITSGISYIAGRAAGANPEPTRPIEPIPVATKPLVVEAPTQPVAEAPTVVKASKPGETNPPAPSQVATPVVSAPPDVDPALTGQVLPGQRYIQVGAVERNVAVLLTQTLRGRGLKGFVAAGPTNGVYRVLVGPLPQDEEYASAKASIDGMGIPTFTRQ
jgi:hypothetical protein